MAYSKAESFPDIQIKMAAYAKALSHPARIAILQLLIQKQTCICGDIVAELPLSQSTVSQHLKELKSAGLVTGEIDGPRVCYCLDKTNWEEMRNMFNHLFARIEKANNNCC